MKPSYDGQDVFLRYWYYSLSMFLPRPYPLASVRGLNEGDNQGRNSYHFGYHLEPSARRVGTECALRRRTTLTLRRLHVP